MSREPAGEGGRLVVLGRITGLRGVKGWVRIHSYTEPREAILGYAEWWLGKDGERRRVRIVDGKASGRTVAAAIEGVADRDAAALLVDAEISVPRERLPRPAEGQYYWADLEGLEVRHRDGRRLGRVAGLIETGANDVLVVEGANDSGDERRKEILIPFVPGAVILEVDTSAGVISVDWDWD